MELRRCFLSRWASWTKVEDTHKGTGSCLNLGATTIQKHCLLLQMQSQKHSHCLPKLSGTTCSRAPNIPFATRSYLSGKDFHVLLHGPFLVAILKWEDLDILWLLQVKVKVTGQGVHFRMNNRMQKLTCWNPWKKQKISEHWPETWSGQGRSGHANNKRVSLLQILYQLVVSFLFLKKF